MNKIIGLWALAMFLALNLIACGETSTEPDISAIETGNVTPSSQVVTSSSSIYQAIASSSSLATVYSSSAVKISSSSSSSTQTIVFSSSSVDLIASSSSMVAQSSDAESVSADSSDSTVICPDVDTHSSTITSTTQFAIEVDTVCTVEASNYVMNYVNCPSVGFWTYVQIHSMCGSNSTSYVGAYWSDILTLLEKGGKSLTFIGEIKAALEKNGFVLTYGILGDSRVAYMYIEIMNDGVGAL